MRRSVAVCVFGLLTCVTGAGGADVKWPVEQLYRIEVEMPADRSWKPNVPVGVSIDFARDLAKLGASPTRIDPNSIQVMSREGASAIPHRLTGDWGNDEQGSVWWRTPDASTRHFYIYFDSAGNRRRPAQQKPALVGVADSFLFNNGEPVSTAPGDVDWDGDGLLDRLVCRTRVYEFGGKLDDRMGYGVYFHKNIGTAENHKFDLPIRLKSPTGEYLLDKGFLYFNAVPTDWNADGHVDLVGFRGTTDIYVMENTGRHDANNVCVLNQPRKALSLSEPSEFRAGVAAVMPSRFFSPSRGLSFVDWDGDGDQDLLLAYYSNAVIRRVNPKEGVVPYGSSVMVFELVENVGRTSDGNNRFDRARVIRDRRGVPITASGRGDYVDWDGDGDFDLVFQDDGGQPSTNVQMWTENTGTRRQPVFQAPVIAPPQKTQQSSKVSARQPHHEITAYSVNSVDWDGDGVLDLVCSHYTGYVVFYRNRGSLLQPVFEPAVKLEADGKPIYHANYVDPQADEPSHWGPQTPGEPNGPAMSATVFDWDVDGDLDLFINSQNWTIKYYENVGTRKHPKLARGRNVMCDGDPYEFAWRSRVAAGDLDADGQNELVVLSDRDRSFYRYIPAAAQDNPAVLQMKVQQGLLLENGKPARGPETDANNNGDNHARLVDWDGDGDLDLLNASLYGVRYYENVGTPREPRFREHGRFKAGGEELHSSNHASACDAADWNGDGRLDLIVGAEGGQQLLLLDRSLLDNDLLRARVVRVEVSDGK